MSLKEKIAIGFVIIMVVVFAFVLRGTAANVTVVSGLDALAKLATYDRNAFMNINYQDLSGRIIKAENYKAIYYKSAMCMYHRQPSKNNDNEKAFRIANVIDFTYEDGRLKAYNNRSSY